MSGQTTQKEGRIKLIILILMFLLPTIAAWYLVFFTDYARDDQGVAHGVLINPPRQLGDIPLMSTDPSVPGKKLHGKWTMLFFARQPCDTSCQQSLYRIRQIRLATGNRMAQVQRVIVIDRDVAALHDYLSTNYPGQLYVAKAHTQEKNLSLFADQNITEDGAIFLIDPRGFLMMRYSGDSDPSGIIRDLSRLLRISIDG